MSSRPPLFPGEPTLVALALKPSAISPPPMPDSTDALSDPSVEDIAGTFHALLPPGAAWRSPDGAAFEDGTALGNFWRALAGDFATLYGRIFTISRESTAATIVNSLADWEHEFGLPDLCFGEDQTDVQRLRALLMKVRSTGTITVADFVDLAAVSGYSISITEPMSFECGASDCGGIDEMGGDIEFFWIVKVSGVPIDYFECGVGQCGITPLTDFGFADDLECIFRKIAPAWTRPVFNYS